MTSLAVFFFLFMSSFQSVFVCDVTQKNRTFLIIYHFYCFVFFFFLDVGLSVFCVYFKYIIC
jgi:hypothetical protein